MKRLLFIGGFLLSALSVFAQAEKGWLAIEDEVAAAVKGPQVTVVHFWASWCSNSKAELAKESGARSSS